MTTVLWGHIAAGGVALVAGVVALSARKGGSLHARSGRAFMAAMLGLWGTATVLHIAEGRPDAAVGDLFIGYFVATAWLAARRRDQAAGPPEIACCAIILGVAGLLVWGAATGSARPTPVGYGPIYAIAGACLLAGVLDLRTILRRALNPSQRIARHVWRVCSAFFIATGSFFLGQQDALPEPLGGSLLLTGLAFAPFAAMLFWLVRLRLAKKWRHAVEAL